MAIRHVITDKNGNRRLVADRSYEEPVEPAKENTMKTATKRTPAKATKQAVAAKKGVVREPKAPFKGVIMALNGKNSYVQKDKMHLEESDQLLAAFKRWLSSGETGEFIAIRFK